MSLVELDGDKPSPLQGLDSSVRWKAKPRYQYFPSMSHKSGFSRQLFHL